MRWKWILGVIGLVIVALIAALYVIMVTYDFNKLKPRIARAVLEATGRQLTLGGDFKVAFGLSPTISVENVNLQNAPWGSRPEMVQVKRMEIQLALLPLIHRELQFKRLILKDPNILVETDRTGRSNLEFKAKEKPEATEKKGEESPGLLPLLSFEEIRIENAAVDYHDEKRGKTYSLKIDRLIASLPGGERPTDISLKGTFNGQPFEVQGTTGPIGALMVPQKPWPVKLTAKIGGATMTFEGSLREVLKFKGLDLSVNAEGPSIRKVAEFGGVTDIPDIGAFKLSAKISDSAEEYQVTDLKLILGDNDLAGSAQLNLSGKPTRIKADLSSQKIDLRPVFPQKKKTSSPGKSEPKKEKVFSGEPLHLEALKSIDAQIKMQAGRLQIPGILLTNLKTELKLENGNLAVNPLSFISEEGAVHGFFNLSSQEGNSSFTLNVKVDQLNVGSLLKDLETKQVLEGKLDAEIGLSGRGRSIAEWMAGLNGRTVMIMGKGRIENKYMDLLGTDLAQGILRLINPFGKGEDFTQINCLVNGFDIKNGMASCTALVLDTSQMSVAGGGDINLKEEKLNLHLQPSPKKGIGVGGVSLNLGELTKPFRLAGTLAHPSLGIDTTQALTTLSKAVEGGAASGLAGVLSALSGTSSGDKNPCLTAIEAAKRGGKPEKKMAEEKKIPGGVQEGMEGVSKELEKLFKK